MDRLHADIPDADHFHNNSRWPQVGDLQKNEDGRSSKRQQSLQEYLLVYLHCGIPCFIIFVLVWLAFYAQSQESTRFLKAVSEG